MTARISKRLNAAAKAKTTDSSGLDGSVTYKYYLVQETDQADVTPLKLTFNAQGFEIKAEMLRPDGTLQSALVRWHQLKSELSARAFQEISEKDFNDKVEGHCAEIHGDNVVRFSEPFLVSP